MEIRGYFLDIKDGCEYLISKSKDLMRSQNEN